MKPYNRKHKKGFDTFFIQKEMVESIGNPAGIGQGTGLGLRDRNRDGIGLGQSRLRTTDLYKYRNSFSRKHATFYN